jgi:hypothetical protein
MPNWCANDVTITGKTSHIDNMLTLFDRDTEGNIIFSFEKIHPTPEGLKSETILMSSETLAIKYKSNDPYTDEKEVSYLGRECVLSDAVKEFLDDSRYIDWMNSFVLAHSSMEDEEKIMEYAKSFVQMVNNIETYGFASWYTWRINNWNTKWDVSQSDIGIHIEAYKSNRNKKKFLASFDTAWSPPIGVFQKLSEMYPDLDIKIAYFEGGCGFKGVTKFKGGEIISHKEGSYRGSRGG